MHNAIEIRDLRYAYPDDQAAEHVVFEDLNLDIRQGSFVAVLGHNGCGKSTLAKHLNAILLPEGGSVMVYVAFAPENLGVASEEIRRRVDAALEAVGMLAYKKHAPHLLSGGQKQRVAIAGVLAMQPKTIVLDEPTAMLDPQGRQEVVSIVEKLSREQNITVVLITHHMDEAVCADRVIAMDDGKIIADGTPKEVFVQIELLKRVGLTVPQTTLLLDALNQDGCALPLDALSVDECADALYRKIMQAKA